MGDDPADAGAAASGDASALRAVLDERPVLVVGYAIIAAFLLGFFVWGGTVALASAAIAPGTVTVRGQVKAVQHPSGGVVRRIHVTEGDHVVAGEPLVTLDAVAARTAHDELDEQVVRLGIELARWESERRGDRTLELPEPLAARADGPRFAAAVRAQTDILEARRDVFVDADAALDHELAQVREEADAASTLAANLQAKLSLVDAELGDYVRLERDGLTTRAERYELERERADVALELDAARSTIALARERRAEIDARRASLVNVRRQETAEQMTSSRDRLAGLMQQLENARATLDATVLRAPIAGTITGSGVNTVGGVIAAGQTVMQVVPSDAKLVVETRVEPGDRDAVAVGQSAQVRFSAFDRRSTLPLVGEVSLISADRVIDPTTQLPYYRTVVELGDDPARALSGAQIHPGMQADVMIVTGEQTLLQYLMAPITRSFDRALREN